MEPNGREHGGSGGEREPSVHRSETFREAEIRLDGRRFEACRFERCRLVYGGGPTPVITGCHFADCTWSFADAAANTLAMLAGLATGGFAPVVEPTLAAIREGRLQARTPAPMAGGMRMIDLGFGVFPVPRVVLRGHGTGNA